eukprot:scaffold68108_cov56-Phaeocystis_antarctica.AAC.6
MSPSRTASLAIIVPTRSPFCEISKSQKSGHVLLRVLLRPHQPVPQTMYWSQTESSKWSLDSLSHDLGHPFIESEGCARETYRVSCVCVLYVTARLTRV